MSAALINLIKKKEIDNPLCELNEKTEKGLIGILQEANVNPNIIIDMKTGQDLIRNVEKSY